MLHQLRVTADGNALIQGVEVIIIKSQSNRQTLDDKCRKILTVTSPLLLCIALDQLFKNVSSDQRNGLLF